MPFDPGRGNRIRDLLDTQNWEIEEFSRQSGIGRTTLYGYLRGAAIGGSNLTKLIDTLNVGREAILGSAATAETEPSEGPAESTLRDLVAAQQETNAILLRLERLLGDQRAQQPPSARHPKASGNQ